MAANPRTVEMKRTLKKTVVPFLRAKGFTGSFPHFRRRMDDRIDLLTFLFSPFGPFFHMRIGTCGLDMKGVAPGAKNRATSENVRAVDVLVFQPLGPIAGQGSSAFAYGPNGSETDEALFDRLAGEVIPRIMKHGEQWWARKGRGVRWGIPWNEILPIK